MFKGNNTSSVRIELKEPVNYTGECNNNTGFNYLQVEFKENWTLVLNYTLVNEAYFELNLISLSYTVDNKTFPNVSVKELGDKIAVLGNLTDFSANKDNSYKCTSKTQFTLDSNVSFAISGYQAQAFFKKDQTQFGTGKLSKTFLILTSTIIKIASE